MAYTPEDFNNAARQHLFEPKAVEQTTQKAPEKSEATAINFGQLAKAVADNVMRDIPVWNEAPVEQQPTQIQPEKQEGAEEEQGVPSASGIESGANAQNTTDEYGMWDFWSPYGVVGTPVLNPSVEKVSKEKQQGESNKDYAIRSQGLQDQETANNYIESGGYAKDISSYNPYAASGLYGSLLGESYQTPASLLADIPARISYNSALENAKTDEDRQAAEQNYAQSQQFNPLNNTWGTIPDSAATASNINDLSHDAVEEAISAINYDGTPEGDLTAAMADQTSGNNVPGIPSKLQGRLAQSFWDSYGSENDYFTTVTSEIYEYFKAEYEAEFGGVAHESLFDFCRDASADEFWEFAQFAHSLFGMYSGREFENADGSLDYEKFITFYNECKNISATSMFGPDGGLQQQTVALLLTDYQTAQAMANYLISSGYANTEDTVGLANNLWATSLAGGYDSVNRAPTELLEDAYNRMGQEDVKLGDYQMGGEYSARDRLPEQMWKYNDPDQEGAEINWYDNTYDRNKALNIYSGGNDIKGLSPEELVDLIVYSQGYGFNRGRQ